MDKPSGIEFHWLRIDEAGQNDGKDCATNVQTTVNEMRCAISSNALESPRTGSETGI